MQVTKYLVLVKNYLAANFGICGAYNPTPHDVLVKNAWYKFQKFEKILPLQTECDYESF